MNKRALRLTFLYSLLTVYGSLLTGCSHLTPATSSPVYPYYGPIVIDNKTVEAPKW